MASPNFYGQPSLFGIPQELRNNIYRFATKRINLSANIYEDVRDSVSVDHGPILQMLAVNRQIRDEYLDAISSKTVLIFHPLATPYFHLSLQDVMRNDVPLMFLASITQCELNLVMLGYVIGYMQASMRLPVVQPFDTHVRPMVQTMLNTLQTVVSPSANIRIRVDATDTDHLAPGGRLDPGRWNFHLNLLRIFKTNLLDQLLHDSARDWPRPRKLHFEFFLMTPLHSTLPREEGSDAMTAGIRDVQPGHPNSGAQVLWRLIPTEMTEGEQPESHSGFVPEMVKILGPQDDGHED